MESLAEYASYPIVMAFVLGVAFLHVGLRSRPSLIALVSLVLMLAWMSLAHRVVHEYVIPPDEVTFERIGQYSAHPVFDTINGVVTIVLTLVFVASFLLSALLVSVRLPKASAVPSVKPAASPTTKLLWIAAAAFTAIAMAACLAFRHLAAIGPEDARSILAAVVALVGAAGSLLLATIAIRRRLMQAGR